MTNTIFPRSAVLLAGAIAVCAAGACTASRRRADVAVEMPAAALWTTIGALPAMPEGLVLRYPSLAIGAAERIVAGTLLSPDSLPHAARPYLGRLDGTLLPMPPGNFRFWYPRGAFDAAGAYHLVWGEADDREIASGTWPSPRELWHAAYTAGAWSSPVRVLSSDRVDLSTGTSPLAIDGQGCVHVVVTTLASSDPMALMHVRGHCTPWVATRVASIVTYASVAAVGPTSVVVALAGRDTVNPRARNVIQLLRSDSGGPLWPVGKIAVGDPLARTHRVWIGEAAGHLHAAWSQETPGGESIVHVRSADTGRTWRDTSVSEPIAAVLGSHFVAHPCGVVSIVETYWNGGINLLDVNPSVPAPRAAPVITDVPLSVDPALGVAADSVLLVASVSHTGAAAAARLAVRLPCRTAHPQR